MTEWCERLSFGNHGLGYWEVPRDWRAGRLVERTGQKVRGKV